MIIDTFPAFLTFWKKYHSQSIEEQIDGWANTYLSPWKELFQKQVDDYASDGYDWRQIGRERIFPRIEEHLQDMTTARNNLVDLVEPVLIKTKEVLGFDFEIVFTIYVGIGLGAGWATSYDGIPAVLFGLENIAEEGWCYPNALTGLIAHEISHLVHFYWREINGLPKGNGPLWQLYTEGFAQWCEHLVTAKPFYRLSDPCKDWLAWCQENLSWLSKDFLKKVGKEESVRDFFGSWFDIQGYSQCGYYLGCQIIDSLCRHKTLAEVATLEDYETPFCEILLHYAK